MNNSDTKACPICTTHMVFYIEGIDLNYTRTFKTFSLYKCPACGHQCPHPQLTNEEVSAYYPKNYYSYNTEKKKGFIQNLIEKTLDDVMNKKISIYTLLFRNRIHKYPSTVGHNKNYLDIGCGDGEYLSLVEKYGWNAVGFELGTPHNAGKIIYDTHIKHIVWGKTFDYIVMRAVLEHVLDPHGYMDCLREMIDTSGEIHIMVPNANSVYANIFGKYRYNRDIPRHVNNYTVRSLTLLVEQHGMYISNIQHMSSGALPLSIFHYFEYTRGIRLGFLKHIIRTFIFSPIDILTNIFKSGDLIHVTIKKEKL